MRHEAPAHDAHREPHALLGPPLEAALFSRFAGSFVAVFSLAAAIAACSSSTETAGSSGSSGSSGSTSSSNTLDKCGGGGEDSKCTEAETQAHWSCITSKCDAILSECYGSGYENGSFGGTCGDYISCVTDCECNDMSCLQQCPMPSEACSTCVEKLDTCMQACPEPACMKSDGGDDGATCADLADCCAAMDEEERATCEQALDLAAGNEVACKAMYDSQCL